ncbi:hypothetical protein M2T61_18565 [Elizabethkingia anophelis]|uniref:hypothetical protein n=1 Tax=Elizabethkingia anophelis TaxID=1117645 RepID=UPI002011B727|nr:hypothetical protein [Elizabethkingia anophelis]MCL1643659.1 hypothetical protein [Elizabethkingia anophelis]MCL1646541.1 hypothetical protein [Elizabethkingia anophelis]
MELKDFIKETLSSIAEGVEESKTIYSKKGGRVNPKDFNLASGNLSYIKSAPGRSDGNIVTLVDFEVALTNENKSDNTGGIGVLFGAVNIGGKTENVNLENQLTRIKFTIPIVLP